MTFTFDDLIRIFALISQDGKISQGGYEMASLVLDYWCILQKHEHIQQAQGRYVPGETK